MSNLKVNSLTKELEFKRKHNQLIDEIPEMVESAIEASEDILSQIEIEYDSEKGETNITFPKGIIPIKLFFHSFLDEDDLYFDYNSDGVFDPSNSEVVASINYKGDKISINIHNNLSDNSIREMLYIKGAGDNEVGITGMGINFYDVLVPFNTENFFEKMTHSFNELEKKLRVIIESAINASPNPVACTQAQWNTIKSLLDKSLYINYSGFSMVKIATDGMANYQFGGVSVPDTYCNSLVLVYDESSQQLIGYYTEI